MSRPQERRYLDIVDAITTWHPECRAGKVFSMPCVKRSGRVVFGLSRTGMVFKLTDPECYRFLEKVQELGIKNIHAHKGPTIWPLNKDAFAADDVDAAATDFQDLNFIIEHAGIPRIEDFCFMAVQEPNVYAGCSVVIGGLMNCDTWGLSMPRIDTSCGTFTFSTCCRM